MTIENKTVDLTTLRINRDRPPENGSGRAKWIVLSIVAVVLIAAAFWVVPRFQPAKTVSLVSAALTFPSQANAVLTASGYIVPQRQASVASKGTGRLVYLGVEEGDHVKSGQIIARLESHDVEAALNQGLANLAAGKAQVVEAEAAMQQARKDFERNESLFKTGVITDSEFEIKKLQYESAEARRNAAKAALNAYEAAVEAARVQIENTIIRAPFDGTVLTKQADVGEIVAPFAAGNSRGAVVTMADMRSLQLEADVSESNIERIRVDQPCEIVLDAFPERRYRGVVWKIVPTADRAKATILTKIKFLDIDEKVLPEMSAKATFLREALSDSALLAKPTLTVPMSALVHKDGKKAVFLFVDGKVREVVVTTGSVLGDRIEILGGVKAGDRIVNSPGADLSSGDAVKPKE